MLLLVTPGPMELGAILLIAILLFGANKIPELARSTGEAMGEFQKGRKEVEKELEQMTGEDTESTETSEANTELNTELDSDSVDSSA